MENNTTNPQEESKAMYHEHHDAGQEAVTGDLVAEAKKEFKHKKLSLVIVVVIVLLGALFGLAYKYKSLVVAAMVDGKKVGRFEVIKELERQGGKSVLDSLINQQLLENEAAAKGVTVSNEDVQKAIMGYDENFKNQGSSLDEAMKAENLTREELEKQVILERKVEKLLADKINVSDEEVNKYIADNTITLEPGKEDATKQSVREDLRRTKLTQAYQQLLQELRSKAKIQRFVSY